MTEEEKKSPILEKVSTRRTFIKNSGLTVGGLFLGGAIGSLIGGKTETITKTVTKTVENEPSHVMVDYSETRQFFKRQKDFDALNIATERIYPEDEHGPGAIALGVPYFIDKQLAGPWGINADDYMKGPFLKPDPSQLPQISLNRGDIFILGIRKLNEVSLNEYKDDFINLNEEQQIEILQAFESGEIKLNKVSSATFFGLLRQATLEGAYSDPMYGGNKNMAGWKMKEFPGAQISYAHVLQKEEFVLIEPISLGGHH